MLAEISDPERALSVSYALPEDKDALTLLWALDEKFGAIVAGTSEATIGEMRLLWWREALEKLNGEPPAEPLLQALAEHIVPRRIAGAALGEMAEGWFALLQDPCDEADIIQFAHKRGATLFWDFAHMTGNSAHRDLIEKAGRIWALNDLAMRADDSELSNVARQMAETEIGADIRAWQWPRALRPLGALTILAIKDIEANRHDRRQGAPRRILRMLWHRITGR